MAENNKNEFKLEEFPGSVQQLADFAVSVLKLDSGVDWSATCKVLHWDAQIIMKQGNFSWALRYGASDKFTYFLNQIALLYSFWINKQKEESRNAKT